MFETEKAEEAAVLSSSVKAKGASSSQPKPITVMNHEQVSRDQSPSTTNIKPSKRKDASMALTQNNGGNQKAANRKKNINTNVATSKKRHFNVEKHHQQNSNCSQAINVFTVVHNAPVRLTLPNRFC